MKIIEQLINERNYKDSVRTRFSHKLRIYFTFQKLFNKKKYAGKLLDIGCNEGTYSIIFANKCFDVDGLDVCDLTTAEKNAKKFSTQVNLFNMSAEDIDINKIYDYIFCSEVLEHIQNPIKALRSMKKISDKNTKIIISMPNVFSVYGSLKLIKNFITLNLKIDPHQKFPFWKVILMFTKNGYEIKVLGSVYFLPFNRFQKLNLALSTLPVIKYLGSFTFYEVKNVM